MLTHAAGVLASAAGTVVLIVLAARAGTTAVVAASVFGASLILLYTASTLYHATRTQTIKLRLKVLDHCAIYVLIAGTYTPFTLVGLQGAWGWSIFGVIWGLAASGVVFKLFFTGRFPKVSTALYIAMGWLIIIAAVPTIRALPPVTLAWIFAGGVAYTSGTYFYHNRRIPFAHAIWHVFGLAGSVSHGIAVGLQVLAA
ncbi:MAG: hemolysin III family protein [Proteobacteria bacterium]|nr:hemolysin III family protein [Pseudomonadota bacterium]